MTKETNAYVECPECKARFDYSGVDIGGLDLVPLHIHIKAEDDKEMEFCSLESENVCRCSELLVWVQRPDETDEEWKNRHSHGCCKTKNLALA